MSSILRAHIEIEGVRPILWHRFGPDALPLEKQERDGVAGNQPMEWKKTVLLTSEGQLYLEPSYVFGCLRDGAKHTKKGRGTLQSWVSATLQVVESRVLIDRFLPDPLTEDPEAPVYLDIRGVRNPATKGRNVRYRIAASPGWRTCFTLLWDPTVVDRGQMQSALIDAGRLVGLGDGRSIGFGRFEIRTFEVTNGKVDA